MGKILIAPLQSGRFSLRTRTLLTVGLTLLALTLLLILLARFIVLKGFKDLENRTARHNMERATAILDSRAETLDIIVMDWAYWDDTYQFIQDHNEDYQGSNLSAESMMTLQVNVMIFFDLSGNVIHAQGIDLNTGDDIPVPAGIAEVASQNSPLLAGENRPFRGVLNVDNQLMLVAARPILTSDHQGPPQGFLLFGRFIDAAEVSNLSTSVGLPLIIEPYTNPNLPFDFQQARGNLYDTQPVYIHELNRHTIAGYALVRDTENRPVLIMRVDTPRDIYLQGLDTVAVFVLAASISGIILCAIMVTLLELAVLARLSRLSKRVLDIGYTNDLAARVPVDGSDELAMLSHTINAMLQTLEETQQTALESQDRLQQVINSISDCLYSSRIDLTGRVQEHWILSPQIEALTGYPREKFTQDWNFWSTIIHPEDRPNASNNFAKLNEGQDAEAEYRIIHADGHIVWVRDNAHVIDIPNGRMTYGVVSDISARKLTEAALRKNEERYITAFQFSPDIIVISRLDDGVILDANEAFFRVMGFSREEVLGKTSRELSHWVFAEHRKQMIHQLRESGSCPNLETIFRAQNGQIMPMLISARAIQVDNQICALMNAHDIRERKQVEEALASERNLLRTLIDHIPDSVYVKDSQGRLLLANEADLAALRTTVENALGKTDYDFYPRDLAEKYFTDDMQVIQSGKPLINREELLFHETGAQHWILTTKVPLRDAAGAVIGLVGLGRDITQRRRMEAALIAGETRYRNLFDGVPIGLYQTMPGGQILAANKAMVEMFGYASEEEVLGLDVSDFYVNPAERERWQVILEREGVIRGSEIQYKRRDGSTFWVRDVARTVLDDQGHVLFYEGSLEDVTESRQSDTEREQLLRQMQARLTELATVAEVSLRASTILNVDELLWTVSNLTKENFNLYHAHIYLLDEDNQQLLLTAGAGDPGRQMVNKGHRIPVAHERSLVARAARTRQGVIVNNVQEVLDFLPNPLLPETLSEMAIPIIVGDQLIGVLDVQDQVLNRFTIEDINVQTTLAAQIAIAIHNARLFTENARRLAIIENTDDLIVLAAIGKRDYIPVYINPAGMRLLGYEPGTHTLQDMKAALADLWSTADLALRNGIWRSEIELHRHDGSRFPVEETIFAIPNEHGTPRDLAVIATDITARKQSEIALHKANRAFRALSDCNQAMVRALDEQRLLNEVCEIVLNSGGYRMVWVGQVEYFDQQVIKPVAFSGYEAGYLQHEIRWDDSPLGMGPTGHAIRSLQPQIVHDIRNDPDFVPWRDQALARGYASLIVLPLMYAETVFATLNVYSEEVDAFDPEEIHLLIELTSDLAFGIVGLRMRAERQRAEKAEREQRLLAEALSDTAAAINRTLDPDSVMDRILENLKMVVPHDAANIMLIDHGSARVVRASGYSEWRLDTWISQLNFSVSENQLLRTVVETGHPLIVPSTDQYEGWINFPETDWVHSYACAPIRREGEVVGILGVYSATDGFFSTEYSDRLQAFADQAAIAIQNARLFAAEHEQRILAEALSDMAAAVNSTLNFDDVLEQILTHIERVVPHQMASIMLLEGDAARIVRYHGYDENVMSEWTKHIRFPLAQIPTLREMVETHQPLLVSRVTDRDDWIDYGQTRWIQSYLGAPIIRDNEVIGFLNLDSDTPDFFNETHTHRLKTFANQVATAISNAQLFTGERDQRSFSEALSLTAAAINSTLDPKMVMDRILENVQRAIPHDASTILLLDEQGIAYVAGDRHADPLEDRTWLDAIRFPVDQTYNLRQMRETGHALVIKDVQAESWWAYIEETSWIHAYLGAPIMREDEVIGFINLNSATPNFFTPAHAGRLEAFAAQAAIAIQNARLFTAEREQNEFVEALRDTAATINSTLDFNEVLDRIMTNLKRVMPHDVANIMLLEQGTIRMVGHRGYEERGLVDWANAITFHIDQVPLLYQMTKTGQAALTSDTREYENWAIVPETHWIMSYIGAPICREGEVLGFLNLYSETPGFFSPAQTGRLQAFADQAAIALRNARLFADERDQRALAEAVSDTAAVLNSTLDLNEVIDRILANVGRVVPHDAANIMLIEEGMARIARGHGYVERGLSEWITDLRYVVKKVRIWQQMLETGQPFAVPDTWLDPRWERVSEEDWIRSTVKAPIYVEHELIGILHLDSENPGFFNDTHAQRLQTFANQAGIAIQNARLFTAEREQHNLAEALRDTAAAINSTLDFNEVLDGILANVRRVAPYDAAHLMLIREGIARIARCRPTPREDPAQAWTLDVQFIVAETANLRTMAETGRPIAIQETYQYPGWVKIPGGEWVHAQAAAPIKQEGKVIGFLTLDSRTPGFYSQIHADRLQAFADQAAVAIENAQLYDDIQLYAVGLEGRVQERTAEVEAQRAQLQAILDAMGEGVVYTIGKHVIYANRTFYDLMGYSTADLMSNTKEVYWSMLGSVKKYDQMVEAMQRAFQRNISWRGELRLRRKDNSEFDAAMTATQVPSTGEDQPRAIVSIFRDISQEKALQAQRDRFIANASHELRTPLANIKTRLYLIRRQSDRLDLHLGVLERVADSMTELVESLLDVSRFERGVIILHPKIIILQDLLGDVVSVQQPEAERKGLILSIDIIETPLQVFVDPQRLSQVFTNLITNAINYTPEDGNIQVRLAQDDVWAVCQISDTGIGIAPEMVEHVFDPFFRANEGSATGTGLGLTIAKEIMELHGGDLLVDSQVGRGSTFTVKLKLVSDDDSLE